MTDAYILVLFFGLFWMLTLWTWTSPLPLSHYLTNLLIPRRLLTTSIVALFMIQLLNTKPSGTSRPMIGLLLFFLGVILASWAKRTMQKNWGEPGQHDVTRQSTLVTAGPFAFSRNPIYVGLLLIYLGFEFALGSWLAVGTIPLAMIIHRAVNNEETLLVKHFGATYRAYKKRVPRYVKLF